MDHSTATRIPPPAKSVPIPSTLWVKTDSETHRHFKAACNLAGRSMEEVVNQFLRDFADRAGIRPKVSV